MPKYYKDDADGIYATDATPNKNWIEIAHNEWNQLNVQPEPTKEQKDEVIKTKIEEIERNSLRALREAVLTNDKSALIAIEAEIVAEREKLKVKNIKG